MLNPNDLNRLVEIITEEVMAAQRRAADAPSQCSCHAVLYDCCPDRLQGMLDAGASRIGLHATGGAAGTVAGMIDHTLLKPDASRADIEKLCREAAEFHFATVCVNPAWVALAATLLRGSGVGVCSVVGFPLGATTADVKHYETRRAIFDGATEIDMVINIGALKARDLELAAKDIRGVVAAAHVRGAVVKVIIEAVLLTDEEKTIACLLSKEAGADFVKTSTGFSKAGATVEDVALMSRTVAPRRLGVKAAGGIRTYADVVRMIQAGATRVGCSNSVKIMEEAQALAARRG